MFLFYRNSSSATSKNNGLSMALLSNTISPINGYTREAKTVEGREGIPDHHIYICNRSC